ncbi:MAG TPA: transporter substrate-binding protein [Gemmataceae bacterium]|jgi:urea transport system substrate-binding protein|nr:transporter substrate-binding protein [Gemmataceae bacterium]
MSHRTCENLGTLLPNPPADPEVIPASSRASDASIEPGVLPPGEPRELAHYRVLRLLGQGGMGKVYQAEDVKLKRIVALKVMLPDMSALLSCRERFLREARTMAAVRNDHVVTIYEVGQADEVPYLAMEFLDGQTLESWMKACEHPRLGDILRIGREIATGLAAAQASGLIHRDIKPANLWLEAPTGRVKILDFGLARPMNNSGLTEVGDLLGTPSYMSPEQARGEQVDGRSDLFSLGIVLYQLCTRKLPFRGKTITAVLTALATDQPAAIRDLNPNVPPALASLVMQLLEKDPARRPQSAAIVIDGLRGIEGQPASSDFLQHGASADAAKTPTLGPGALSNTVANTPHGPAAAPGRRRRRWRLAAWIAASFLIVSALCWWGLIPAAHTPAANTNNDSAAAGVPVPSGPALRIGVLYSRTGTMAISERAILDGILLAVSEINEKGGVLARPLEPVIEDGQSDEIVFARKAAKLIEEVKVSALFGTWTSASRKAVKEVVEKHNHLLFYPISYEGMEQSPNIIYGGSVPNQQILPALKWSYGFLNKRRWFLAGLDSIYSRAAHAVIRDEAKSLRSQIVGEDLLGVDNADVAQLVRRIEKTKPDLIVNTIKGDTNVTFFRALRRAGMTPETVPTLSFTVSEEELSGVPLDEIRGHYAAGNYFHSIELPRNEEFLQRVQKRFDSQRIVSDPMQTSYVLVHMWAEAVKAAGSEEIGKVRQALKGEQYDAPQGRVTIDPATQHTVQVSRVGVINEKGRFIEVYASPRPIVPEPFPASRDRPAWEVFIQDLHQQWGGRWHNPGR